MLVLHRKFPGKFYHRRFSVSLGSDPRAIKCYGQGPALGSNDEDMGKSLVNRSRFCQD